MTDRYRARMSWPNLLHPARHVALAAAVGCAACAGARPQDAPTPTNVYAVRFDDLRARLTGG